MKQVLCELGSGKIEVFDVPIPNVKDGEVLISSRLSLVSPGTERMLVNFGRSNFIGKLRSQPERLRTVIDKVRSDGLYATYESVRSKLEFPLTLGYCNVGTVIESRSKLFTAGDRVVSNGPHAEYVCSPANLTAKVPSRVPDEMAVFVPLASTALEGIRLAGPTLGEIFVVQGLGVIGILAAQLLVANGCRVIGIDPDPSRCLIASKHGVQTLCSTSRDDIVGSCIGLTEGRGVDGVIICAATASNELISIAANIARTRGRIVLVGVAGLNLRRDDFYKKELSFQVSASYGPGRYDESYEAHGVDYPFGYVRWTLNRNFNAVLDLMDQGRISTDALISNRLPIGDASHVYDFLNEPKTLSLIFDYRAECDDGDKSGLVNPPALASDDLIKISPIGDTISSGREFISRGAGDNPKIAILGAGNYSSRMLIPRLVDCKVDLHTLVSKSGVSATYFGRKYNFRHVTTNSVSAVADREVDGVVVATRHDSHEALLDLCLKYDKHVFLEKPLCINLEQYRRVTESLMSNTVLIDSGSIDKSRWREIQERGSKNIDELNYLDEFFASSIPRKLFIVGFNRRFAPHTVKIKSLLEPISNPKSFVMSVNAGYIDHNHWTQQVEIGGGRMIGEACHFIDLLRFLAGHRITGHSVHYMQSTCKDTFSISLKFEDGSIGTIHYFSNGTKAFPKERLEVFVDGRILVLDDFKTLKGYNWKGFRSLNLWRQDKGQAACMRTYAESIGGYDDAVSSARLELEKQAKLSEASMNRLYPVPWNEILEVSDLTLKLSEY